MRTFDIVAVCIIDRLCLIESRTWRELLCKAGWCNWSQTSSLAASDRISGIAWTFIEKLLIQSGSDNIRTKSSCGESDYREGSDVSSFESIIAATGRIIVYSAACNYWTIRPGRPNLDQGSDYATRAITFGINAQGSSANRSLILTQKTGVTAMIPKLWLADHTALDRVRPNQKPYDVRCSYRHCVFILPLDCLRMFPSRCRELASPGETF